jgi:2-polyprenyl-3-methyl-5-hydroxy-6-metoxy-1,4-benzoquinol methylase
MNNKKEKETFFSLMEFAGITVNGDKPYDIRVHDEKFYDRVLKQTTLGLGEAYMDKWWECKALDQFIEKIFHANLLSKVKQDWTTVWNIFKAKIFNLQNTRRAFIVGKKHYDIGNDLYQKMLDKKMQYTCGYWKDAKTLDAAQEAKLEMVCKKLGLAPGMEIIELGCGFGGFAKYAAQKYGVSVTGLTVSKKQAERMVKEVDEERRKWSQNLYGIDTWDSRLYDLVINIEKISVDQAVDMICNTVKLSPFQTTPESQKTMERLIQEAMEKLQKGPKQSPFFEPIRSSPWRKEK